MLFIQQIRTQYWPNERGGSAAQRRARVPARALLPEFSLDVGYVCQKLVASGPAFELQLQEVIERPTAPQQDDFLAHGDGIVFMGIRGAVPQPKPRALDLSQGWVSVRANGRIAYESTWSYHSIVLNVARFERMPVANHFATHEPAEMIDLRGRLR